MIEAKKASGLCGNCQQRPATGVLGLCEICAEEYGYTKEDIAKHDKPMITLTSKHEGAVFPGNPTEVDGTPIKVVDLDFAQAEKDALGKPKPPLMEVVSESGRVRELSALGAQSIAGRQLDLPLQKHGSIDLIRDRAALWSRRSDKWHRVLEKERAWTWRGVALPPLLGALAALAVVLDAMHVLKVPFAQAWPAFATVLVALVGVRANAARTTLDAGRADEAWVVADRMAEWYRGSLADLDGLEWRRAAGERIAVDEVIAEHLRRSQRMEASARFGLPEPMKSTIDEVVS